MPIPNLTPGPGETYDASSKPPPFGHALKPYFALDEDYVNLNNGSYGTPPLPVIYAGVNRSYQIERNPDVFHRINYKPLLVQSRHTVAKLIGAELDEVVLVPNATHALNTVLRNFEWREGDVIVGSTTTYGAVANTIHYLADRSEQPRPTFSDITYTFPLTHAEVLERFRAKLREVKQQGAAFTDVPPLSPGHDEAARGKGNKIVAVIDAIVANPGALLPWKEMVAIAREEGVWTVIDAAHSIGQEYGINLSEAKPDFWLSNCHKWLWAKRGCAVLYTPKRNQYIIKSSIPTSHEYISPGTPEAKEKGTAFAEQHEWTGTTDLVPYLSVTDAVAFREWLGGEKTIDAYCHQLALDGGKRLAEVMGTRVLDESGELTVHMPNVQLPLPVEKTRGEIYSPAQLGAIQRTLQTKLLLEHKTYSAHYFHAGGWWTRSSAQVFNEVSDFEYLGKAFNTICQEIKETILATKAD
ncbi:PLP-dependent transferase [Trametes versicolor FP-101664 SS1]|uniref:PLP-dependent transferase n=1 Tax=Trametes versicolor (strain FP-101664) TaxID=717944 RepID=UPI0004621AC9|nr:PLP-dependent transferase [Trametes versicolor FP-101664 SS1]EIW57456.1 PLP-dependent transferase [Trametes versicolor FP-101664 SS1]